jgi:hypothetical protein
VPEEAQVQRPVAEHEPRGESQGRDDADGCAQGESDDERTVCCAPLPESRHPPRDTRASLRQDDDRLAPHGFGSSRSVFDSSSMFTSLNVTTLTFFANRAGRYMSQTQASDIVTSK